MIRHPFYTEPLWMRVQIRCHMLPFTVTLCQPVRLLEPSGIEHLHTRSQRRTLRRHIVAVLQALYLTVGLLPVHERIVARGAHHNLRPVFADAADKALLHIILTPSERRNPPFLQKLLQLIIALTRRDGEHHLIYMPAQTQALKHMLGDRLPCQRHDHLIRQPRRRQPRLYNTQNLHQSSMFNVHQIVHPPST